MQPSGDPAPEKEKEKEKAQPKVSLLKLFSFADFYDCVLMSLGSIGACIHGASVPIFFIFFGRLINIIGLAYLFPKQASHKVAKYSLDFVYLSVAILFSSWLEVACWMHTGEMQAAKMRKAYLRSMLSQDISLFDTEASTGEVISAITSDILVVQDALSEKGRKFSIKGLLGNDVQSDPFLDGSLVIFRLAPQDYHRFHSPVSGVIEKFVNVPGSLYTVNPIAINSKYCNVFTENKRTIVIISTVEFGKVAFIAIGATMVGSIAFVRKEGDHVKKGDELGYFSFGGSTVICVFEKDSIKIDEDLLANSARSLETLVTVGMQLGVSFPKLENCVLEP